MKFFREPYKHQRKVFDENVSRNHYGLFWEMGTGKTKGIIDILRLKFNQQGQFLKTLIITPSATIYNWRDEIRNNSKIQDKDIVLVNQKSSKQKIKKLEKSLESNGEMVNRKIVVTNPESLQNKTIMEILLEWGIDVIICDESHYFKNKKAKRTKAAIKLASKAQFRYILTGTPILQNIEDIFSQFLILDQGETFGKNFAVFRRKYMHDENAAWQNQKGYFPNWQARPETYDELTNLIYKKCSRVLKDECLDLPPMVRETRSIELSPEQRKYYKQMERDFIAFIDEKQKDKQFTGAVVAQMAVTKALRLQQIASGFCTTDEGETFFFDSNPRIEETRELLKELTPNHKVIIWCSFKQNYQMIGKLCEELKIQHTFITGEQDADEKREAEVQFQTDPNVRVLVANRRAGGVGINLTAASYSIVFSRNFSLGDELQSEARNHRGGSQIHRRITKIDLVSRGTIDEKVVEALRKKKDVSDMVIDIVKQNRSEK